MRIDGDWVLLLLAQYHDELTGLSERVRERYWVMCSRGHGAAFSDFEGEVLYCLLRELRPEIFFEISPDCGYSTLYAHEALEANGSGFHYAFELEAEKHGRSTEQVIRDNAFNQLEPERFELVLGDASKTTAAYPNPDVVLIDSCHDQWFAEWYWSELLPRVGDVALIQDIVFHDRPEPSSEADWLLEALRQTDTRFLSLGLLERSPEAAHLRADFAPRRPYETNSILLAGSRREAAPLEPTPPTVRELVRMENDFARPPRKAAGYRDLAEVARRFARSGNTALSRHYWTRAVAYALDETNRAGGKALAELASEAVRDRRPGRALGVLTLSAVYCRPAIPRALRNISRLVTAKTRVLRGRS